MGSGSGGFRFLCTVCIHADVLLEPKAEALADLYYMYTQFFAFLMASFWGVFISASM